MKRAPRLERADKSANGGLVRWSRRCVGMPSSREKSREKRRSIAFFRCFCFGGATGGAPTLQEWRQSSSLRRRNHGKRAASAVRGRTIAGLAVCSAQRPAGVVSPVTSVRVSTSQRSPRIASARPATGGSHERGQLSPRGSETPVNPGLGPYVLAFSSSERPPALALRGLAAVCAARQRGSPAARWRPTGAGGRLRSSWLTTR